MHGAGIFTYVWLKFLVNVGKSSLHGSYGVLKKHTQLWGVRFQKTPGKHIGSLPQIEANISEKYLLTQPPGFTMVSEADH